MKDLIKKLTGKNQSDYESVAEQLINTSNVELFRELVNQDDFLFDFVKENVAKRLQKATNIKNYRNLLSLIKVYSPYYEEFITSTLAKFADEDLTDELLEIFDNGTEDEKTYCAKYFSYIKDPLALDALRKGAFSDNESLAGNCANTLGTFEDKESYSEALAKLNSDDDFEQFSAINFLVSYGDKTAVNELINVMQKSSMAENIAGEIPYLVDILTLIRENQTKGLLVLNNIINGLAEILPLVGVFDYNLYEVFNYLASHTQNSAVTTVLINAREKFNTITENDEYLFDEDKNTKNEVVEIKNLLNSVVLDENAVDNELREETPFIYTALDFTNNIESVTKLLVSNNQTLILKSAEILKKLNAWTDETKAQALKNVSDETIKAVIEAI